MSESKLARRLTAMDASFLYFEKKEAPLHMGSVHIFAGEILFREFMQNFEAKLHLLPRYRQVVHPDPYRINHPAWEFDPQFDIAHHLFHLHLDAPGTDAELFKLAGRLLTPLMDRSKPLWEVWIVDGLTGNRSALIGKVHHCMVDGVSGVELLKVMLEASPRTRRAPSSPSPPCPPAAPHTLFDALLDRFEERTNRWLEFQLSLLNLTQALIGRPPGGNGNSGNGNGGNGNGDGAAQPAFRDLLSSFVARPAPLPFNGAGSGEWTLDWSSFSFAEVQAIRRAHGGTINDVMLSVLSGAVSRYAEMHGHEVAGQTVRVMVPVSTRTAEQRGALGNLVSALPVDIPLDINDALERLRYVFHRTAMLKRAGVAHGLNSVLALLGTLPALVQSFIGARVVTSDRPFINVICTNVPGPPDTLYALGRRMLSYVAFVPSGYVGIGCAIMSYEGRLYFGLNADRRAMPDVERLKEFLDQTFAELRERAGVADTPPASSMTASDERGRKTKRTKSAGDGARNEVVAADDARDMETEERKSRPVV